MASCSATIACPAVGAPSATESAASPWSSACPARAHASPASQAPEASRVEEPRDPRARSRSARRELLASRSPQLVPLAA
eukprot:6483293-Alexandrium_andersonii.AAC.1